MAKKNLFKSISKGLKNIFLGDRKEEDLIASINESPKKEEPMETNDLGVNPNEWFDDNKYDPPEGEYLPELDLAPSSYEPPTDDDWFTDKKEDKVEEKTMHQKMYEIATARNNPFHVGGSENAQSEVDYIKKHSPWPGGSENFQGGSERIR